MEISGKYDVYSDTPLNPDSNSRNFRSQPWTGGKWSWSTLPNTYWQPELVWSLTYGDDVFFGSAKNDWVTGYVGNDTIYGGAGNDILNGGGGSDAIYGGEGDDMILRDANDAGNDTIMGGSGVDTLNYDLASKAENLRGVTGDLSTGRFTSYSNVQGKYIASVDVVSGIENVLGTKRDDVISGDAKNNILSGSGGDDKLYGLQGNDTLYGGDGNDRLYGGEGNDTLTGGAGSDWLMGGAGNDSLSGEAGDDLYELKHGSGQDRIRDHDTTANNHDTLVIGSASRIGNTTALSNDISAQQVWLRHVGNDLEISVIGSNDKVTVQDWYSGGSQNRLESIQLGNGRILGANIPTNPSLISSVETLVQAMASFVPPAAGQVNLPPDYAAKLVPLIEANWSQPNRAGTMSY